MKRVMGVLAFLLGTALLSWVAIAMALDYPLVQLKTPLKPLLFSFVLLSAGVGWMSHADDESEIDPYSDTDA